MGELLINTYHYKNITLALAGMAQAASLVSELACHGNYEKKAFATSIQSIYKINSDSVAEIYQPLDGLHLGLVKLGGLLSYQKQSVNKDMLRYFTGMLVLERKIIRQQSTLTLLHERLQTIISQVNYFSSLHEVVLENLASLYSDIFSPLQPRIIVTGKTEYLQTADIIHKIRALLLAGIRSTVLWRQIGGRRSQLIFHRAKILATNKSLLSSLL